MAQHMTIRLSLVPGTVDRAERLWKVLTGVPISPDRKERMVRAVIQDGVIFNGKPLRDRTSREGRNE